MLHFVQHDKTEDVIPSVSEESTHGCFASLSMTRAVSFRTLFFVIPSVSEESTHGCFASLSMTRPKMSFRASARNPLMLRFAQHDKTEDVIPSESEESSTWMLRFAQHDKLVDASLHSA
jgi:hypothetical protein